MIEDQKGAFFSFLIFLLFFCLILPSSAFSKEYDGIWFLGFNLSKPPFDKLPVRQAVAHSLNRDYIATEIMSGEAVPASPIPPGMSGYSATLPPYRLNIKYAKKLMKQAGFIPDDRGLKQITLLHTDGLKTIEIAKKIQADLKALGMQIELVQVSYRDEAVWNRELASKKHQLFLMGYKAGLETASVEASQLLAPLFASNGEANFTAYRSSTANQLLREKRFAPLNQLIYKELPVLVLFYIEKL